MRHLLGCLMILPLLSLLQARAEPAYLEKDAADFRQMRQGLWSNDRQIFFLDQADEERADRVGLAEWEVRGHDEEAALSSRLVRNGHADLVFDHLLTFGEDHIVETLTPAVTQAPACQIAWRRRAGGFEGRALSGACDVLSPAADDYFLTQTDLDVGSPAHTDRWTFRRARPFTCWAAILRGASHGDSGEGSDDWDFKRGLTLHDQGGEALFESDEAIPRFVRLKLRDVDWPYGERRPSLTLYVHEGEAERATSYAWTGGGEDRIGINLRWLQASCTRTGIQP